MGLLIRFPEQKRSPAIAAVAPMGSASIVILPVVRIERHHTDDLPSAPSPNGAPTGARRRKRPARRS